jgi:ComF family protein
MLNLLFPRLCNGCGQQLFTGEDIICASCLFELPLACYHRTGDDSLKRLFYGRIPIEEATALLVFQKKGLVQQLIHNLKYRRQQQISCFLGNWLGADLVEYNCFLTVELVVPVPLHPSRERKRGYNQVTGFGRALADKLNATFCDHLLLKKRPTATQVIKSRIKRYQGHKGFFIRDVSALRGRHVLLVDDLVTSGATIEACAEQLFDAGIAKLSIATMARA